MRDEDCSTGLTLCADTEKRIRILQRGYGKRRVRREEEMQKKQGMRLPAYVTIAIEIVQSQGDKPALYIARNSVADAAFGGLIAFAGVDLEFLFFAFLVDDGQRATVGRDQLHLNLVKFAILDAIGR